MKNAKIKIQQKNHFPMKTALFFLAGLMCLLLTCIIAPEMVMSQPPPPPPPPNYNQEVPIDGGLGLLAAAGVTYAVNKLRKKKS